MADLGDFAAAADPSRERKAFVGKLADLLAESGIAPEDIGRINRVNAWQGMIKKPVPCEKCHSTGKVPSDLGDDGDEVTCPECSGAKRNFVPETVDMVGVSISPSWEDGPRWELMRPAATYGVRAKEVLCNQCLDRLRAGTLVASLATATEPATHAPTGGVTRKMPSTANDNSPTDASDIPSIIGASSSPDTTSPSNNSTPSSRRKGIDAQSVGRLSQAAPEHGTSTTTISAALAGRKVVAGVCVVCSAPTVTPTWRGTNESTLRRSKHTCSAFRVTALVPDPQIGFRRMEDGTLVPMHDEFAIACMLELLSVIRPHRIVNLGDTLDLAEWSSKFLVLPEFVLTTQPAIDYGHRYLAEQQAAAGPQCEENDLLEGNHDNRLPIAIARNALAAMRLRRAAAPGSWPVLSVPHLLRLDELGVTYHDGYPAGRIKIADAHGTQPQLWALHGERISMEKQARAERVATVQGHAHHFSMHSETYFGDGGEPVDVEAWSLGCLCRRQGGVPSTHGGTHSSGQPVKRVESWQHGIGVVLEDEDGWELLPVRIRDGRARWDGKVVTASQ